VSHELRLEVVPRSPFRLPAYGGRDGVLRRRGGVLERLLHLDGRPAVVRVAQTGERSVLFGAWAEDRADAEAAIARMRFALGVDDDLRPFYERFRDDPLIGPSLRRRPWLRISRRPVAFEALAWAICEQLIQTSQANLIEARIVRALGPRCPQTGLRDVPTAAAVAACSPARLESFELAGRRAIALVRVAREVAAGRIDLEGPDHERAWRRLLAIPNIGRWTVEMLAQHGQGRYDVIPAGDLGFLKALGHARSGGDPAARAEEAEVRALFARYGEWRGLAGAHALHAPGRLLQLLTADADRCRMHPRPATNQSRANRRAAC
jgi:3-methyladenine DNA glycosylase/8-oxoguanine DNA glycosylase